MKKNGVLAAIMLGGNVGDTAHLFSLAEKEMESTIGQIVARSQVYTSEPWGMSDQPPFKNQALVLSTTLTPLEILARTRQLEKELGRVKREVNGPREIDIDILLYGDEIVNSPELEIPHPRLHLRKFNLVPLAEIAPEMIHPKLQKSIAQLAVECNDTLDVYTTKA